MRMTFRGTRLTVPALLAAVAAACAGGPQTTAPAPAGGASPAIAIGETRAAITADDARHRLFIIAHDSMGGRDTGSPGLRMTAEYIAGEMSRLGLRPAGDDGTWFHRVNLERTTYQFSANVRSPAGQADLAGSGIVPISGLGGLPGGPRATGEGNIVYAGYMVDPTVPANALTAGQLDGATIVLRFTAAPGVENGRPRFALGSLIGPASTAAAVILVAEAELEDFWPYASQILGSGSVAAPEQAMSGNGPAVLLASPEAAERLIGRSIDGARQPITSGLGSFRYELREQRAPLEAFNVVAALPGRDPALAGQYVTLGAHYDHEGIGEPVDGDSIYNGADDNGSGTVALIEVAERLAHLPTAQRPARSVLFVWHTAEEKGLLGSEQFTDRPPVPMEAMVAHINMDMVGRNHPDTLMLVGSRRISTEFGDLIEAVNSRQARPFALDYSFDTPDHPERIYCRSDHWNFARYGVPTTFFTTGLHDDYHKPSDTPDKIEYEKLARVATLAADIVMEVGNRAARPRVDQPVPPLGTPCS